MKRIIWMLIAASAFAAGPLLSGCGKAEAPAAAPADDAAAAAEAPAEETHEHDHEHEDHADEEALMDDSHDHHADDHGEDEHAHGGDDHGHSHEAPRGGALVELGDHVAHFEVLHSAQTGTLKFYAMDGHVEAPVRLTAPSLPVLITLDGAAEPIALELQAVASELTGETVGDTSEFAVTDERLIDQFTFQATLPSVDIRGVAFENVEFSFPEGNE